MKKNLMLFVVLASMSSAPVWARGDAAAGAKLATDKVCVSCHGEGGAKPTTPEYPILAGQHEDYLRHSLMSYKNGKRKNPIMAGMAAQLSKKEIKDLAAYFASQKGLEYKY